MPTLRSIARHWGMEDGPARCYRCGITRPHWTWDGNGGIDRAHIITRCYGGLDDVQNIIPLCIACHRMQPGFGPGDEDEAMAWMNADPNEHLRELCRRDGFDADLMDELNACPNPYEVFVLSRWEWP